MHPIFSSAYALLLQEGSAEFDTSVGEGKVAIGALLSSEALEGGSLEAKEQGEEQERRGDSFMVGHQEEESQNSNSQPNEPPMQVFSSSSSKSHVSDMPACVAQFFDKIGTASLRVGNHHGSIADFLVLIIMMQY